MRFLTELLHISPETLWCLRKTCYEMIADRKYLVTQGSDHEFYKPCKNPTEMKQVFTKWLQMKKQAKIKVEEGQKQIVLDKKRIATKAKNVLRKKLKALSKDLEDATADVEFQLAGEMAELQLEIDNISEKCALECQDRMPPFEPELTIIAKHPESKKKLAIVFLTSEKLAQSSLTACIRYRDQNSIDHLMMVSALSYTPAIKAHLFTYGKKTLRSWTYADLKTNITHHKLVPKHILLSEDEKQQVCRRFKLTPDQFPWIRKEDPVAKYFHFLPGQVIKILMSSETAGLFPEYRIVK